MHKCLYQRNGLSNFYKIQLVERILWNDATRVMYIYER